MHQTAWSRLPIGIFGRWRDPLAGARRQSAFLPWLAVLICVAAGAFSIAVGPDNNWDLRFYHLYAPWAYLHGRYLQDIAPAQEQGFFNPTADLLFYAQIASPLNAMPRLIAFIMGAVHGLNAVLVLAIAVHTIRPLRLSESLALRSVAFLLGTTGAGFISLLGATTNDLINAIFVLAALLALLRIAAAPRAAALTFAWPGAFTGIGLGLKYTAAIFIPGLGLLALLVAWRRKNPIGLVTFTLMAATGFLAVAGHHLLTLWSAFGNPVFPLLNGIFRSPYYEPVALRDARFAAHDLAHLLAYPFYWTKTTIYLVTELAFRDWRGAIAYSAGAAALLAIAFKGVRSQRAAAETRGLGLILIFVAVSYLTWAAVFGIYRYAVALEMVSGIVAVGGTMWVVQNGKARVLVSALLLGAAFGTTVYPDWGHGAHPSAEMHVARFGDKYIDVRVPPLPANSLVLLATTAPVAYFIPFAEPTARYLGIDNNMLSATQDNLLAAEVGRLMQTPGPPKFILNVDAFDGTKLNGLLARYGLTLDASPCRRIRSNIEEHVLSLCAVVDKHNTAQAQ
jgi:hypothetical protein